MSSSQSLYAGLMSGTSLDGIDAVLVDFSKNAPELIQQHYHTYPTELREQLLALHHPQHNELHLASQLANQLAELYASTIHGLIQKSHFSKHEIQAIGCHGQTIRHRPELGYTLQLGNGALLAERTGITVVNDFRSRDIAAGGQGAPLVPAFHQQIMAHPTIHRVIVNIGGISNLTNLAPKQRIIGFDCGPGNLLMDSWCQQHRGQNYDSNGDWAKTGTVIPSLLQQMLATPFFQLAPPKSTGRDLFNSNWLQSHLKQTHQPEDIQATLLELSCISISQSIQQYCLGSNEVYLCGGGARNGTLCSRLQQLLPTHHIGNTNELGVDPDYLEAIAFAWLAQQTMLKRPSNLPDVTGAKHQCILGSVHFA